MRPYVHPRLREAVNRISKKDILESEVESHLRVKVELVGGQCVKFIPDYKRGFPDRLVLLPGGKSVWVETKRPVGGKPSPSQLVAHEQLRRLGQRVEMVWTKEAADRLVEALASGCK
jgi:hypothetical protein